MSSRYLGVDLGAETIKMVELVGDGSGLRWTRRQIIEHHKEPARAFLDVAADWDLDSVDGVTVSGRLSRILSAQRTPAKQAQTAGFRFLHGDRRATVISIGSHGFSVLELRAIGIEVFRENSRCSQGTGNFLRQLVERFGLSIEEAAEICESVDDPAPLSGRCPVILKTDMTHLANKGEARPRILAGLFDAVCENVQVLVKPRVAPSDVVLTGGVMRSQRVRRHFAEFLARHDMRLLPVELDDGLFIEAVGDAVIAAETEATAPAPGLWLAEVESAHLDRLPALSSFSRQVHRMERPALASAPAGRTLVVGIDVGSTGSKVATLDCQLGTIVWEEYTNTNGDPVGASQTLVKAFIDGPVGADQVVGFGVTGSGREIVGSLLSTTFGVDRVYVLNEIAAHAEGALHYDQRVDTIFEIGGQDAKYIRLADGRVVDAAMNEACSAGTGSFIEEQGRKFSGIEDVVQLAVEAASAADGVSLGQHCSVFMAEIIDEAVAAGVENRAIIAGIYDSIIQNYLNRVKGSRSVGDVIFCQGMPFSADPLAAAVVRQTGSEVVIPPNPGTVGALGIALLARKAIAVETLTPIDPARYLDAEVLKKDTFHCNSTKGCGGAGNHCRIDRIKTRVGEKPQRFTWGGGCSLWDRGTGKTKLPDRAPDPFRRREELVADIARQVTVDRGNPRVGMTDEFQLKGLFPFFATFIFELGFDITLPSLSSREALKRGIEEANVPFCAPMQHYHGLVSSIAEKGPDLLFMPMIRSLERSANETHGAVCPVVQGSPDVIEWDLGDDLESRIISPVIDISPDLRSTAFMESCARLAAELGSTRLTQAYDIALEAQMRFHESCQELGAEALHFCEAEGILPVVVLGRTYTIYNTVLNSNVPALMREQGAVAIPVDCYPVDDNVPVFDRVYWEYGQRNLRAAHQIRRSDGVYSIWCSNYSCGPDSFNLHFYAYIMDGKPYAVIETDGHSGDAGTKTRVEAFLHCVREDLSGSKDAKQPDDFAALEARNTNMPEVRRRGDRLLIPRMGPGAEALAACMRGLGIAVEPLPMPDQESVRLGRRYTSGKECVPMTITLGSLLQRLEQERDTDTQFTFLMPSANGPCRFGVYNLLHKIVLERLGWNERVRVWSPVSDNYFEDVPAGFSVLVLVGFAAFDMLQAALFDTRPRESRSGAAQEIFDRRSAELNGLLEEAAAGELSMAAALIQVASGRLFGCAGLLREAAVEYSAIRRPEKLPTVLVVGEIYVRCDPVANDFIIDKLEERGIAVRFAPFVEWLEYTTLANRLLKGVNTGFGAQLSRFVQWRILTLTYQWMAERLQWPRRTTVKETLDAAEPLLRKELVGEAVLTLGGPIHEWREGLIDGVVSVGPLECMPTKLAETQYFHAAESAGLISLTLPLNGDPVDPELIDNFVFDVKSEFQRRGERARQHQDRRAG